MNLLDFAENQKRVNEEHKEAYSCCGICQAKVVNTSTVAVIAVLVDDVQELLGQHIPLDEECQEFHCQRCFHYHGHF